jgi:hypothetical protein
MSEVYPWYGTTQGSVLAQGDLLESCPLLSPIENNQFERLRSDVLVLSQTCDLLNDKVQVVLVCPVFSLAELATSTELLRSKRGREELRRGNLPGYHLLDRCYIPGHESDFRVCDFRSLFGVHVSVAKAQAESMPSRIRLMPPYREHLAQAYARYIMRVGLPMDIPPFS